MLIKIWGPDRARMKAEKKAAPLLSVRTLTNRKKRMMEIIPKTAALARPGM